MTDKQRIEALREAIKKMMTARGAIDFGPHEFQHVKNKLYSINSIGFAALEVDYEAETAGGDQ